MSNNEFVTTKEVLSRCWKVAVDIQIPSFTLCIERTKEGKKKKTEHVEVFSDKVFLRRRQAVRRTLIQNGTAFDGGYLIPDNRIEAVIKEITVIGREFLAAIPGFIQEWPVAVDALCIEVAEDADKIRAADMKAGGAAGLAAGLQFRLSKYRINPDDEIPLDLSGIDAEVRGLAGQISHEVAMEAKHGAPAMTGTVQAWKVWLSKVISKVEALAFVNPNLEALIRVVRESVLPALVGDDKGRVDESTGFILGGVLSVLRDPGLMLSEGSPVAIQRKVDGIGAVAAVQQSFDVELPATAPVAVAAPVVFDFSEFDEVMAADDEALEQVVVEPVASAPADPPVVSEPSGSSTGQVEVPAFDLDW